MLGEAGKQEILTTNVPKILDLSNLLPNRYFPKIDVGCCADLIIPAQMFFRELIKRPFNF